MKICSLIFALILIKYSHSDCLSNEALSALGWTALNDPVEVSDPPICAEFYKETSAKACVDLETIGSVIEEKTNKFAEEFSNNQFKILSGLDSQIAKYGEAKQKLEAANSTFEADIKSAFDTAGTYIDKYDSDVEKIRDEINKCNLIQQTNSFGNFCLMSSDKASEFITEASSTALTININAASASKMADGCADSVKNTCVFLEVQKALTLFDGNPFASSEEKKCSPDFLDCMNEGGSGSGCSDATKNLLYENFSKGVGGQIIDPDTSKILEGFSSDFEDLFDKLGEHGFGPIQEGGAEGIQSIKGFVDNFNVKDLGDSITNATDGLGDNITDTVKDTLNGSSDVINDALNGGSTTISNGNTNINDAVNDALSGVNYRARILETSVEITYKVTENGYDSYKNGENSGMKTKNNASVIIMNLMILFSGIFIHRF
jgi:hypothetical protein